MLIVRDVDCVRLLDFELLRLYVVSLIVPDLGLGRTIEEVVQRRPCTETSRVDTGREVRWEDTGRDQVRLSVMG